MSRGTAISDRSVALERSLALRRAPQSASEHGVDVRPRSGSKLAGAASFTEAARRYWSTVFPLARREIKRWQARASAIPDDQLRDDALAALRKRSNLEGAAAFASFAPRAQRVAVVRASVCFQAAYDYIDVLSERPHPDPERNARSLNRALEAALRPCTDARHFYSEHGRADDRGYLAALLRACGEAVERLPSGRTVIDAAQRAAARAGRFQALNFASSDGTPRALAQWAASLRSGEDRLAWWELVAGAGSSLAVHALLAEAASAAVASSSVLAIERAYFPSIGALHSLLDQLVDREEDTRAGHPNISLCYRTPSEAAAGLSTLARRAREAAEELDVRCATRGHSLLLAAMVASYLTLPQARSEAAVLAREAVIDELGPLARASIAVFEARRLVGDR